MNIFPVIPIQRFFRQEIANPFLPEKPSIVSKIHLRILQTKTMLKLVPVSYKHFRSTRIRRQPPTMRTNDRIQTFTSAQSPLNKPFPWYNIIIHNIHKRSLHLHYRFKASEYPRIIFPADIAHPFPVCLYHLTYIHIMSTLLNPNLDRTGRLSEQSRQLLFQMITFPNSQDNCNSIRDNRFFCI